MYKGISTYLGLGAKLEKTLEYLNTAKKYGYDRLFTSLHIPEADSKSLLNEFTVVTQAARDLGFMVVADISPLTFALLGASLENLAPFRFLSVDIWRFDFGFSEKQIADFMRKTGYKVQINASTMNDANFQKLVSNKVDFKKIDACHNFYPRAETGLSIELFAERTRFLKAQGLKVGAFIPAHTNARAPLFAGLPSVEAHRFMKPLQIAKHFAAMHIIDGMIFGDPFVNEKDLQNAAGVSEDNIELTLNRLDNLSQDEDNLLNIVHTNRLDPGAVAIRSENSRGLYKMEKAGIKPLNNTFKRLRGTVTVDNEEYGRYAGELQIILQDLPADARVNSLGKVTDEELFLLSYIRPGERFSFKKKEL